MKVIQNLRARLSEHYGDRVHWVLGDLTGDDEGNPTIEVRIECGEHSFDFHVDESTAWNAISVCVCVWKWGLYVAVRTTAIAKRDE